jgi:hypothetical protein
MQLPNRRNNVHSTLVFEHTEYEICVGVVPGIGVVEIFADGEKQGSDMEAIIDDACIVISIALQHGALPEELAKSVGMIPAFTEGKAVERHASIIGRLVAELIFVAENFVKPVPVT